MSTPALRFKDNDGRIFPEWKNSKLGDICSITTGKLDANAMVEGGQYRFYTCAKNYYWIDKYAFDTDALLISGNGANVGYIHHYKGKFNAYQRTYVLDKFDQNINFVRRFLDANLYARIFTEKKEGNTPYIVMGTLTDMEIQIPAIAEQIKIANFLTAVDEKIAQLTRKHDLLTQYKKGVMQQIFSQELRFKDDDGQEFAAWAECTIGEIATQKSKKLNPENSQDNLRCIELEHISQSTGQLLGYVDARKQKSLKSQFSKGDVLFGKLRPADSNTNCNS